VEAVLVALWTLRGALAGLILYFQVLPLPVGVGVGHTLLSTPMEFLVVPEAAAVQESRLEPPLVVLETHQALHHHKETMAG
jgi:hypothetical protein